MKKVITVLIIIFLAASPFIYRSSKEHLRLMADRLEFIAYIESINGSEGKYEKIVFDLISGKNNLNYKFTLFDRTLKIYHVLIYEGHDKIASVVFNNYYDKIELELASKPDFESILLSE